MSDLAAEIFWILGSNLIFYNEFPRAFIAVSYDILNPWKIYLGCEILVQ
jgi:hypothetical protein